MNVFQSTYDERLRSWYDLRTKLNSADTKTKCVEIDAWWQRAPLVNHYLHPHDVHAWPGPWELISENNYCHVARGLGMCYTLALTGVEAIDFCQGKDDNNEDVMLVLVEDAKYILNYYPNSVLSSNLRDFKITARMDLTDIIKKIK
jgi:hypothetical protein